MKIAAIATLVTMSTVLPALAGTGGWSNVNDRYVMMGQTAAGESVSLNIDSIQKTGSDSVGFAYWIQRDYVKAIANCRKATFTVNWINGKTTAPRTYTPDNHSVSDRMVLSACNIGLAR